MSELSTVYVVLKNADFIEGRGQMRLHSIFSTKKEAHEYIMSQDGIFGSPQNFGKYGYNGYEIKEMPVNPAWSGK